MKKTPLIVLGCLVLLLGSIALAGKILRKKAPAKPTPGYAAAVPAPVQTANFSPKKPAIPSPIPVAQPPAATESRPRTPALPPQLQSVVPSVAPKPSVITSDAAESQRQAVQSSAREEEFKVLQSSVAEKEREIERLNESVQSVEKEFKRSSLEAAALRTENEQLKNAITASKTTGAAVSPTAAVGSFTLNP